MNPKKQKVKERRRARKLADEAWEAANSGNLDLAEKIIRRAVATQADNPVLWNDQGTLLGLRGKHAEAADSYRAAISLAPTFAEPYAHLAALRIRAGLAKEAVLLQAQAVNFAPDNVAYAEQLAGYRSLIESTDTAPAKPAAPVACKAIGNWAPRLTAFDWDELGRQLLGAGCCLLPALLTEQECAELCRMFDDHALFDKTVLMDRPDFGQGVYRYFRAPIPELVEQIRRAVYPHAARIANGWQRLLNAPEHYPNEWEAFRDECSRAGQSTPTPILLKYGPGGFNALHRDLRGRVYFPLQMAVVLSPRTDPPQDGFSGGDFLLCDVPEGRKAKRRQLAAGLGDAIVFCTRDRLVSVGGLFGLQPVKHGVTRITAGERFVLGVPFHEYR